MGAINVDIFKDSAGEWRYRVRGGNGEIMVTSEGYTSEEHAKRGFVDLWEYLGANTDMTLKFSVTE